MVWGGFVGANTATIGHSAIMQMIKSVKSLLPTIQNMENQRLGVSHNHEKIFKSKVVHALFSTKGTSSSKIFSEAHKSKLLKNQLICRPNSV